MMDNQDIADGKNIAVISYLTIFGTIIAFFSNKDKKSDFAAFHIRQAIGLWLTFFVLGYVISAFDSWLITFCFWMFFRVYFNYRFKNPAAGRPQSVPLIGSFFQKLFSTI